MKVALAGTLLGSGGVQTHFRGLAQALSNAGHQVLVLSLGKGEPAPSFLQASEPGMTGCVSVCYPYGENQHPGNPLVATKAMLRALRHFKPDLYMACGTGWNLFVPAILSSTKPIKIFHEVMSGEANGWTDTRWLARRFFEVVIAQAKPVAANFEAQFGWPKEIPVLPAFPEPLERMASCQRISKRVPMGEARAAFFSRLVPHKRAYWLVQQWPDLSVYLKELHIYGSGPEEAPIRALIAAEGWGEAVFCHGAYPSGRAYRELLSSFDLTLLPTVGAEGAPLVLLESMASGVPFVSTDAGGISDYANADCVIVSRSAPEDFLLGVGELAGRLDSDSISQTRLRMFYQVNFSFEELSRRWLAFMSNIARQSAFESCPAPGGL